MGFISVQLERMDFTFTEVAALVLCLAAPLYAFVRTRRLNPFLWRTGYAALFLVAAALLTYYSWGDWSVYVRTQGWPTTEGTISNVENDEVRWTGVELKKGPRIGPPPLVTKKTVDVSYIANGQVETWHGTFDGAGRSGETIQIKYDPDNPKHIVQVTTTSDDVTPGGGVFSMPAGKATNNTVSSIAGLPLPALWAMYMWIASIPFFTVLLATWLASRRRQAGISDQDDAAGPSPVTTFETVLSYATMSAFAVLVVAAVLGVE